LGSLSELASNLLACDKFVGVDSGISHLAGTLCVPCDIICLYDIEPLLSELIQMYHLFYPETNVHRKSEVFKICKFHL
jgi:ADP-heptose:LPS heptosyltransferase